MDMQHLAKVLLAYQERLFATINHGWWTMPISVADECELEDNALALCHIVHPNTMLVKETALLEWDIGIHSTYMIPSFMDIHDVSEVIAFLMSLEHEVGVSLELFKPFMEDYVHPHTTIRKAIEPFKKLGLPPKLVHFPNSPYTPIIGLNNQDYFSQFHKEKTYKIRTNTEYNSNRMIRIGVHPLEEYGLESVVGDIEFAHSYENRFEAIQPEDTGKSILYLNLGTWEVA